MVIMSWPWRVTGSCIIQRVNLGGFDGKSKFFYIQRWCIFCIIYNSHLISYLIYYRINLIIIATVQYFKSIILFNDKTRTHHIVHPARTYFHSVFLIYKEIHCGIMYAQDGLLNDIERCWCCFNIVVRSFHDFISIQKEEKSGGERGLKHQKK